MKVVAVFIILIVVAAFLFGGGGDVRKAFNKAAGGTVDAAKKVVR